MPRSSNAKKTPDGPRLPRLHKIIASAGLMSRRAAEKAITDGRVKINGEVVTKLGSKADPDKDKIEVDGSLISTFQSRHVYLFHKPKKVLTTKKDDSGRKTIMDFLPKHIPLNPVGRLDFHSEGLLILTNDGALAQRLSHPSHGIEKEYLVQVEGHPNREDEVKLQRGIHLSDGKARFLMMAFLHKDKKLAEYRVVVNEGKNRLIRRMFAKMGYPVRQLVRIRVGPFHLGNLQPGELQRAPEETIKEISRF